MTSLRNRHTRPAFRLTPVAAFLNAESGSVVINALSLPIAAHNLPEANEVLGLEVIPPPGPEGILPSRNGRPQRIADPAALVARLNAQEVAARVDFDHRSEPRSPTFSGSTEAEGWASAYRLNARGAIVADVELADAAYARVRERKYRYLSPALLLDGDDVVGLSSVALVNNPNLPLGLPAVNSEVAVDDKQKQKQAELDKRESELKAREDEAAKAALNAAEQAVDAAIRSERILPAQKDYHLNAIRAHPGGVWKGIESFNAFVGGAAGDATQGLAQTLTARTGPAGKPPETLGGEAPQFPALNGVQGPSDERLALHGKIAEYATKRGIPYRQAVIEFGAIHGV